MTTHTTSRRTAAIAFAGAGAIAMATLAPAAEIPGVSAPDTALSVALAAATNPLQAFIEDVKTQVETSGAVRVNAMNTVPAADAPAHIAAGLVASAIRAGQGIVLGPQQFAALVGAISTGNEDVASAAIRDIIDGPLWAADPTLLSAWEGLPAPAGGEGTYTGAVWDFREQWRTSAIALEDSIINALYPDTASTLAAADATPNPLQAFIADVTNQVSIGGAARVNNPTTVPQEDAVAHIAAGLAASAIRTVQGLVLAPQQIAKLATGLATGDDNAASAAIVDLIDGPLWSADPALLSVWEAAPKPIGGEGTYTGTVWTFRESWRTTGNTTESNVLDALKLPKPDKLQDTTSTANLTTVRLNVAAPKAAATTDAVDATDAVDTSTAAAKKDATDDKTATGATSEPTTKVDDSTASSGRHRKSTAGAHRASSTKAATAAKKAKASDNGSGDKSADK